MALTFKQTSSAADGGVQAACSGRSVSSKTPNQDFECSATGSYNTTNISTTLGGSESAVVEVVCQSKAGEPGLTSWAAGDWTVDLNIVVGNSNITLEEVHICRLNSSSVSQASVGSNTGLGITCTAGVKSVTVTGSSQSASGSDMFLVVWIFTNSLGGNQSFQFDRDQDILMPEAAGGIVIPTMMHSYRQRKI